MAYSSLEKCPILISHNVKGLNILEKRIMLLRGLKKVKPSFVFLHETHFKSGSVPKLFDKHYSTVYHALSPQHKSKGVSILITQTGQFWIIPKAYWSLGQISLLTGNMAKYASNPGQRLFPKYNTPPHLTFCRHVVGELKSFAKGCILLGDINVPLSPLQDTSNGKSTLTYNILKGIKTQLNSLALEDSWRLVHPLGKDFTVLFILYHTKNILIFTISLSHETSRYYSQRT